jgi:peroxiredoxin Q/BCP
MSQTKNMHIGDTAPDFTLPDQSGDMVSLSDFKGKIVVLYFYPKDNSPGCTTQACTFRDRYELFKEAGAEVVGISSDSSDSHKDFTLKHELPFVLLSDEKSKVRQLYNISSFFGLSGRVTFVIDKEGIVRHVFSSQFNPKKHVEEALKIIKTIHGKKR